MICTVIKFGVAGCCLTACSVASDCSLIAEQISIKRAEIEKVKESKMLPRAALSNISTLEVSYDLALSKVEPRCSIHESPEDCRDAFFHEVYLLVGYASRDITPFTPPVMKSPNMYSARDAMQKALELSKSEHLAKLEKLELEQSRIGLDLNRLLEANSCS